MVMVTSMVSLASGLGTDAPTSVWGSITSVRTVTCTFRCGRGEHQGRLGYHAVVMDLRCDATDVGAGRVRTPWRSGQGHRVARPASRGRPPSSSGDTSGV